jgi:thiamine-monophosphate kinase
MQSELAWLAWVRRAAAPGVRPELRLGIGDDAAIVRPRRGCELVLTTDLMIEGVHFLLRRDPPAVCGRRLATRALSDLAAMGAEPLALLVSTAYPAGLPVSWPRAMVRGLIAAAAEARASLVGGDVSSLPGRGGRIMLDVVGAGQVPAGRALLRSGAQPGDRIFVSGPLGEAALGRRLVHAGRAARSSWERRARARHLRPRARWELGRALRGLASAAIDVSDGLATDLRHLCRASGVGADIIAERLPLHPGRDALRLALGGGEDYELLFTLPPGRRPPPGFALHPIGVITAARRLRLQLHGRSRPLPAAGWQHWPQTAAVPPQTLAVPQ